MKIPFANFVHINLFESVIEIVFDIMFLFITLGAVIGTAHEAKIGTAEIYALSALIAVLRALRIGSVLVFQREKVMLGQLSKAAVKKST